MIQPFAPGGAVELYARTITAKVAESIGQPFVIESRPGAGGNIAANYVAKAAPDGYTILQNQSGQAISPAIYRNLPFDAYNDFIPVTLVTTSPIFLVASGKSQFKSIGDFIAAAKANPGSLSYGSAGVGTSLHFAMELLKSKAGIDVVHVPYRGVAPNTTAMIAGDVAVSIMPFAAVKPHIEFGSLRILGVTAAKRTSLVPESPTIAESGFPDYELVSSQGWFVPAKTPREIVNLLQREAAKALASKDVQDRLSILGVKALAAPRNNSRRITRQSWPYTNVWHMRPRLPRKIDKRRVGLRRVAAFLVLACLIALASEAFAQSELSDRPVRIVVNSAPGGGTDILARVVAAHLSKGGQNFFVENRGGGGGIIGIEA